MPPWMVPIGLACCSRSVSSSNTARPGAAASGRKPLHRAIGGGAARPSRMARLRAARSTGSAVAFSGLLTETQSIREGFSPQPTVLHFGVMPVYPEFDPSACSVARTLDVLGDTWSILVLRDVFLGAHRFDKIQQHLGIARNVLAARLKRLIEHGLLEKRQYQAHPPRFEYHLTRKGLDLQPVLVGLMQWGDRYVADASGGPVVVEHRACGHPVRAVTLCEACDEPVSPRQTTARSR